jgi:hypothetical protein
VVISALSPTRWRVQCVLVLTGSALLFAPIDAMQVGGALPQSAAVAWLHVTLAVIVPIVALMVILHRSRNLQAE